MSDLSKLATQHAYLAGQARVADDAVDGARAHLQNLRDAADRAEDSLAESVAAAEDWHRAEAAAKAELDAALDAAAAEAPAGASVSAEAGTATGSASTDGV